MSCASTSACRACASCSSASRIAAAISTFRTATSPTPSSTPAPTTTTPPWAGGVMMPPSPSAPTFKPTSHTIDARQRHRLGDDQGCRRLGRLHLHLPLAGHPAPGQRGPHEYAPPPQQGTGPGAITLDALHPDFASQLAAVMEMTDRDGYEEPMEGPAAGGPTDEASLRVLEGSQS